jgi:hypothetical protein
MSAAITSARSPNGSKSIRKNCASWGRKACSCARWSLLQAQKRQVLACPVLYRSGAPLSSTYMRYIIHLGLTVLLMQPLRAANSLPLCISGHVLLRCGRSSKNWHERQFEFYAIFAPGTGREWRYVVPFDPNWIPAFSLLFLGIAIGVIALKH